MEFCTVVVSMSSSKVAPYKAYYSNQGFGSLFYRETLISDYNKNTRSMAVIHIFNHVVDPTGHLLSSVFCSLLLANILCLQLYRCLSGPVISPFSMPII